MPRLTVSVAGRPADQQHPVQVLGGLSDHAHHVMNRGFQVQDVGLGRFVTEGFDIRQASIQDRVGLVQVAGVPVNPRQVHQAIQSGFGRAQCAERARGLNEVRD
jgi:hypothetical protein